MRTIAILCLSATLLVCGNPIIERLAQARQDPPAQKGQQGQPDKPDQQGQPVQPGHQNATSLRIGIEYKSQTSAEPAPQAKTKAAPVAKSAPLATSKPTEDDDEDLNDATIAFDSALPVMAAPAMRRVGRYEYTMFSNQPNSDPNTGPFSRNRRVGFYAVKYRSTNTIDQERLNAAWYGARAVQAQLVSLDDPGLGSKVNVVDDERIIIGVCSFGDDGQDPYFGWLSLEHKKDLAKNPKGWAAYFYSGSNQIEVTSIDDLTEADFPLVASMPLGFRWPPDLKLLPPQVPVEQALRDGIPPNTTRDGIKPVLRVIPSASSLSFSIEFPDDEPPVSFHRLGQYKSIVNPDQTTDQLVEQNYQLGSVIIRGSLDPNRNITGRAAAYGADVLRRRRETIEDPSLLGTERVSEDRQLVLFTRDTRSGEKNWLTVAALPGQQDLEYVLGRQNGRSASHIQIIEHGSSLTSQTIVCVPNPPKPGLKLFVPPESQLPVQSFPLFLGGRRGLKLTEIRIIPSPRTEDRFAGAPTPLFDVQYQFLELR